MLRLRTLLLTCLLLGPDPLPAQGSTPEPPRCDPDLADFDGHAPVFVRMRDQLLPDGKAWPAFQQEHQGADRRALRRTVLAELQQRADKSWSAVAEVVATLEQGEHVVDAQRFWIVNGFACDADAEAVARLAGLDAVAWVHRQTQPGRQVQHRTAGRASPRSGSQRAREQAFDLALELTGGDRNEAPFDPAGLTIPWNVAKVRAPEAWALGADGSGVVVAVMDSGLLPVPALYRALWRNPEEQPNGKDDDGDGRIDDLFGWDLNTDSKLCLGDGAQSHGTMCAGIIVGRAAGEPGIVTGLAPRARLMVLRGMGRLDGYEYAALHGADVLSMSYMWVGIDLGSYRGVFRTAHEHLAACGIVAVGGAGNFATSHPEGEQIGVPKDIPCVLAMAGIDQDGNVPPFSSRGPVRPWSDVLFFEGTTEPLKPDLTACNAGFPLWHHTEMRGRRVEVFQGFGPDDAPESIGLIVGPRGNSFAGPHAAGAAALVLSAAPATPSWRVAEVLRSTAEDLGEPGHDPVFGHGLLRCDAAVAAARDADARQPKK